jgi:hypothetical protein
VTTPDPIYKALFGPLLTRPEIAALPPPLKIAWWILAHFQLQHGSLPPPHRIATDLLPDHNPYKLDQLLSDYFPDTDAQGNRYSKTLANEILEARRCHDISRKRKKAGKLGGLAKAASQLDFATPVAPSEDVTAKQERLNEGKESGPLLNGDMAKGVTWVTACGDYWRAAVGKPNFGRIGAAVRPVIDAIGEADAVEAFAAFVKSKDAKYGPGYFTEHYHAFVKKKMDSPADQVEKADLVAAIEAERQAKWSVISSVIQQGKRSRTWYATKTQEARTLNKNPIDYAYEEASSL